MKNITAAGNLRQGLLVPGAEPRGEIGDGGLGSEASVDQFQQPDAPGIGVAMLFRTQQEAKGGLGSSVFKCKTSRIGPSGPWPSGGCARSSSRSLATPDSSPGSIGPTDSSLTSVHRYAW